MKAAIPYLSHGIDPTIIIIASKNVPAPGPGAGAYSVAKAGLTQLGRVAALELGTKGIRVNMIHPNQVFDTAIWTKEVLEKRARHYGLTVEQYKTNNILHTEITSKDVANLVCAMAGPPLPKPPAPKSLLTVVMKGLFKSPDRLILSAYLRRMRMRRGVERPSPVLWDDGISLTVSSDGCQPQAAFDL